jgi:glycine cleavage system aminomethyltransferase T
MTADYTAATAGAAWFDRPTVGKLLLTGPDAPTLLHNVGTNDIRNLPLGAGCPAFFCNERARALFFAVVYHVLHAGDHAMWLETAPGRAAGLLKYLDRFVISEQVELADVSDDFAQVHLAGPMATDVLEGALADDVPELPEFGTMERTFGSSATVSVRRRTLLGVPGYDLVGLPDRIEGVKRMLTASGATPGTPETFEVLRVEAGTPVEGIDFDDTRFVMEVGNAAAAVSYAKGCFPGQEPIVMARDRAGRVNRSFLRLKTETLLPPGTVLKAGDEAVGVVTSSAVSPRSGTVAVGYVHWKHVAPGTQLLADGGGSVAVIGPPQATAGTLPA